MVSVKVHVSLGLLLGACCLSPAAFAKGTAASKNTFFTGEELAQRLMVNVVLIDTSDHHKGAGFAIGGDGKTTDFATTLHTLLRGHDPDLANAKDLLSFVVTFCADNSQEHVDSAALVHWDPQTDLAIFRVKTPKKIYFVAQSVDSQPAQSADPVWSLGREGDCKVGGTSGTIDKPVDDFQTLIADMPGAAGGTSGSPVMSARGIVGMATTDTSDVKLRALSISQVQAIAQRNKSVRWSLVDSENLPPTDPGAAARELTQTLNDYIFRLKDFRDAQLRERYRIAEMYQIVTDYNTASNVFKKVKDKHDGTLELRWSPKVRAHYDSIRTTIDDIHEEILGLNALLPTNSNVDGVTPPEVRRRMSQLSPRVDALDVSIKSFVIEIRSGGANVQANQN